MRRCKSYPVLHYGRTMFSRAPLRGLEEALRPMEDWYVKGMRNAAVAFGHVSALEYLVKKLGASKALGEVEGLWPKQIAERLGHRPLVAFLTRLL